MSEDAIKNIAKDLFRMRGWSTPDVVFAESPGYLRPDGLSDEDAIKLAGSIVRKNALSTRPVDQDQCINIVNDLYRMLGWRTPDVVFVESPGQLPENLSYLHLCRSISDLITYNTLTSEPRIWWAMWHEEVTMFNSPLIQSLGLYMPHFPWNGHWGLYGTMNNHFSSRAVQQPASELLMRLNLETQCLCADETRMFISERPSIFRTDQDVLPHSPGLPALEWKNGHKIYYWHGIGIDREWIEDPDYLEPKMILEMTNLEGRRIAMEIVGLEKIIQHLDLQVVDKDRNPQVGTLLRGTMPEGEVRQFLKVECGTGRTFVLQVAPHLRTALGAQAWTWGIHRRDFVVPEVRT